MAYSRIMPSCAGAFGLTCLPDSISYSSAQALTLPIALPAALVGVPLLLLGAVIARYWKRIFQEFEARRNRRLKSR